MSLSPVNKKKQYFRVAVTIPVRETFTYSIPADLMPVPDVGHRVLVPFRNRKIIGYILEREDDIGEREEDIKDILDILDPEPLFHPAVVPFFKWMSEYYLCPLGRLIQSALPAGLNIVTRYSGRITPEGLSALSTLPKSSDEGLLLLRIKENPGKGLPAPIHTAHRLADRGWITIERRAPKSPVGPLKRKHIRLKQGVNPLSMADDEEIVLRAKNEKAFLEFLAGSNDVPLQEISHRFSNGTYLVNKWMKAGLLESYDVRIFRDPAGKILVPSPEPSHLYEQQEEVLKTIREHLEKGDYSTCLLHGATGSGKTEVYYRAVKYAIELGRQAILMAPEIALAVYIEGIFRSRLGERVAVFHSALSLGERYDQWMRMLKGDVDLVIGARSALFAPLSRLGLIIVDEEYDFSYKQEEAPRYHARDAAVVRGKMEKALVILGAGTPSVQSFQNSVNKRYQLLSMPDRINKRPQPEIEIIDMKAVSGTGKKHEILSPELKKAIEENVKAGKQAILFLNRRGFSRVYLCRSCGDSMRCPNCELALTYHQIDNLLVCHYCGFQARPKGQCPSCGNKSMKTYGFGTERLEGELAAIFPGARICRMDRDSTRRKGQSFKIIKQFSENKMDILVGTQMITKGYDFPNVTLVGVIAADFSLGFPDFRAGERTYQILSQVAGRAGRGEQSGRVIIQTFNPGHYAIQAATANDYEGFFQREKELRDELEYPPFSYLACLRFQGNDKNRTAEMARQISNETRALLGKWPKRGKELRVLGPADAPLSKLKGKHRMQVFVKCRDTGLLHYLLREIEGFSKKILRKSGVGMIIDVDPYQML